MRLFRSLYAGRTEEPVRLLERVGLADAAHRKVSELSNDLILAKKAVGKTVLITTHNMQAAEELCDRVAFIVDGQIKLIDSPRELKLRKGQKRIRVEYRIDDVKASEEFPMEGLGDNRRFLQLVCDYPLKTVHSLEASLEQIFIDVTGRRLA